MMDDELCEIFSWLFKPEYKDNELLTPVSQLHEIIALDEGCHAPVWVLKPEVFSAKPPRW